MTQKVKSSLLSITAGSVVQVACSGGAALISTMLLGAYDRGVMVIGLTLSSFFALISCLGVGSAFRSYLPSMSSDEDVRARLVSAFCWCSSISAALAMVTAVVATVLSAALVEPGLAAPSFAAAVGLFAVAQVALLQINEAWFAEGRFIRGSATAAATAAGGLIGVAASAALSADAATFLFAQAAGNLAVSLTQLPPLRRAGLLHWARPPAELVRSLLHRGVPALGMSIGLAVVLRADRYLLGVASGPAAVGVYSVAATVSETIRMLPQAVGQLFFREASLGHGAAASGVNMKRAVVGGAISAVGVAAFGWVLIVPVFGAEFAEARVLLLVLLVAELCFAPYAVASRGLLGAGRVRAAACIGVTASVVSIAVYSIAAELGAAMGVAIGSGVVYGFMSILAWVLLRRGAAA